jgi:choline dehydrogenase-like flavoprotein
MGSDPKKSVLDAWNHCHDIKNLLVVDASAFVSHPEKSVTLTIMALAMRASEHLTEEIRLGNV